MASSPFDDADEAETLAPRFVDVEPDAVIRTA